jgi:thiamine pyrophosphate-dependent acetolactate synthase large subunit-like protein
VIVIVGCPFDFRLGYGRRLRSDATVVQIDLDYRNVGKNRDISLGLVGRLRRDSQSRSSRLLPAARRKATRSAPNG